MKMKPRTKGWAVNVPLSFSADDLRHAEKRVADYRPKLMSRSQYIRVLIDYDRKHDVIGRLFPKPNPGHRFDLEFAL